MLNFLSFFTVKLSYKGLLGSISLLHTEHLSVPEMAFKPPQLPLIFLFINITPNDIIRMIIKNTTNVIIKISIVLITTFVRESQSILFKI